MSPASFHANKVAIEDNDEWCLVGFADQENDTQGYLQLQRSRIDDSQDQALGLNSYYVERDDQSNSCYGGVESCELFADMVRLRFTDAGSLSLNLGEPIQITFDIDGETLSALRYQLASIFAGTECLRDCTSE